LACQFEESHSTAAAIEKLYSFLVTGGQDTRCFGAGHAAAPAPRRSARFKSLSLASPPPLPATDVPNHSLSQFVTRLVAINRQNKATLEMRSDSIPHGVNGKQRLAKQPQAMSTLSRPDATEPPAREAGADITSSAPSATALSEQKDGPCIELRSMKPRQDPGESGSHTATPRSDRDSSPRTSPRISSLQRGSHDLPHFPPCFSVGPNAPDPTPPPTREQSVHEPDAQWEARRTDVWARPADRVLLAVDGPGPASLKPAGDVMEVSQGAQPDCSELNGSVGPFGTTGLAQPSAPLPPSDDAWSVRRPVIRTATLQKLPPLPLGRSDGLELTPRAILHGNNTPRSGGAIQYPWGVTPRSKLSQGSALDAEPPEKLSPRYAPRSRDATPPRAEVTGENLSPRYRSRNATPRAEVTGPALQPPRVVFSKTVDSYYTK
jgi:hypothetical protein